MYSAHDIAIFIINWCNDHGIAISNLKLQKLLYFVQGESSKRRARLIRDDFYAWQLGPVIPNVYSAYAMYSSSPIPRQPLHATIDPNDANMISSILSQYANFSTWALVEKTHRQDPWKYNYNMFGDRVLIPYQSISNFFNGGNV